MYTVPGDQVIFNFNPQLEPVLRVPDDSLVLFEANDCFSQQIKAESDDLTALDPTKFNPATGPVYIEGAAPGDVLRVEILTIDLAERGCTVVLPGGGALPEEAENPTVRTLEIRDGRAVFKGLEIPLDPMIGVIGVAPAEGAWPTDTPWRHGGNMDTTDIRVGSTLYLPVAQKGALFALGDCHGVMGDGEVCISGLEIPADVLVRLSLVKDRPLPWPLLETPAEVMVVGSGDDLEHACRNSLSPLVAALSQARELSWEEAYMLASLAVDLRISQIVNPKRTARAAISRHYLTAAEFLRHLPHDI